MDGKQKEFLGKLNDKVTIYGAQNSIDEMQFEDVKFEFEEMNDELV
jgi:hypothetical protein